MASTQQILSALTDMQKTAQGNLPVIPNNGNPAGAYNMPQQSPEGAASAAPKGPDLSWLEPSAAMQGIQQRLAQRRSGNEVAST